MCLVGASIAFQRRVVDSQKNDFVFSPITLLRVIYGEIGFDMM